MMRFPDMLNGPCCLRGNRAVWIDWRQRAYLNRIEPAACRMDVGVAKKTADCFSINGGRHHQ